MTFKIEPKIYVKLILYGALVCARSMPAFALAQNVEKGEVCETQSIMTLAWTVCLFDTAKTAAELHAAIDASMAEIHRIDNWMSEWKPASEISKINDNAGIQPVHVSDEAFEAIQECVRHGELSEGAFDISFNAFFGLYSWKPGHERFPTDKEIKDRLPLVNYKNIELDSKAKTVFLKKKRMKIGLGGMGEGWAVDKVVELLKPRKIQSGYVDASGAIRFWGRKPTGKLWTIGVGNPRPPKGAPENAVLYKLYTSDIAVTTANDVEKGFTRNGRRYHHIIDPRTGYSADRSIQVTAFCKTATLCDFVDDEIFIMGPEKGLAYAEKNGVQAVIVAPVAGSANKVYLTKGLKEVKTEWGPALELP